MSQGSEQTGEAGPVSSGAAQVSNRLVAVGGAWMMAARLLDRGIGVISVALLARLLQPVDFGLVAMAGTVVAALEMINAFGFDWALVRHEAPTRAHYDTAWTLRVLLGLLTLVALAAVSPLAASFYGQPALMALLTVMGVSAVVAALENIGTVDFRRSMNFGREFYMRSVAKVAGFLVTVGIAWWLRSYWALVLGTLASRLASTLLSYWLHSFRPRFSLSESRNLMSFSIWLLIGNIFEFIRSRFADFYVAKMIGARGMGIYVMASELAHMGISEVAAPINRAAYSKYAIDLRSDGSIKRTYLKVAPAIWLLALPITMGTLVVAPEAIRIFLGPTWKDAVSVLQLTAIGAAFTTMTANTHYVYWALNRPNVVVALSVVGFLIAAPLTVIWGRSHGVDGVVMAYIVGSGALVPINLTLLYRMAQISVADLLSKVWRVMIATAAMVLAVKGLFPHHMEYTLSQAILLLATKAAMGVAVYALVLLGLWRLAGMPLGVERDTLDTLADVYRSFIERCHAWFANGRPAQRVERSNPRDLQE
jgi:lipopolysaccharide exporter